MNCSGWNPPAEPGRCQSGPPAPRPAGGEKTRTPFLDVLKGVCLFGVILGHLCTWQIGEILPGTAQWNVSNLYNSLCRVCVPVFLMVTGWLVLGRRDCRQAEEKSWRKAGHFLLCYLVWSAGYTLIGRQGGGLDLPGFARGVLQGEFHLWYLLLLSGVYAMLPLLVRITRRRRDTDRALLVAFASTILLPSLAGVPGFGWMEGFLDKFYLDTGYLFYLLLGCRMRRWPLQAPARRCVFLAGGIGTLWSMAATWRLSCQSGVFSDFWLDQRRLNVACGAAAVFLLFQQIPKLPPQGRAARIFRALADRSLGIYLVHVVFLLGLRKFGISTYALPAIWWLPVLAAAVLAASWAAVSLASHIPFVKRFV